MKDIAGKVAFVTGGASGIGRGIAAALAEKGAHVVVADVEGDKAELAAREIAATGVRSLPVRCDVTRRESVEAAAERAWSELGRVDLLFNNAGVSRGGALLDSTTQDLDWLFAVNFNGVYHGCTVFGRRFVRQGTPAHIVNTGSEHSLGMPHVFAGLYTATKHAVLGLSDVLRRELPDFIGVSVLCPGVVRTEIWNSARNRPAELGGAAEGAKEVRAILERGVDPLEIGRRAVEGVERGDFLIVTHPHSLGYAEARWREVSDAFERQAPFKPGDERYDVTAIATEVAAGGREEADPPNARSE